MTRPATRFTLIASGFLAVACRAQPNQFLESFESYAPGQLLLDQNGWSLPRSSWESPVVVTGAAPNTTLVIASSGLNACGAEHALPVPFIYTSGEPVTWVFQARLEAPAPGTTASAMCGLVFDPTPAPNSPLSGPMFGLEWCAECAPPGPRIACRYGSTVRHGSLLQPGVWYELKLQMDFSITGGGGAVYYRPLESGSFFIDLGIIGLGLTPDGYARYSAFAALVQLTGAQADGPAAWIDHLVLKGQCYADCDTSIPDPPRLNVRDFVWFLSHFCSGDSYANCDGSTTPPVLNVNDFICFQAAFVAGCP
jgi:hypothetical protein